MKFYPNADVNFFVEIPSWHRCCKRGPTHSWKLHDKTTSSVIYYWRDLEGIKKSTISDEDLYFKKWPKTRIRPQACLPLLYATGHRYIRLTQAPPVGFKCAPSPINLEMARKVKADLKKKRRAEKRASKKKAKDAKDKKKGKGKDKGKGKGKK